MSTYPISAPKTVLPTASGAETASSRCLVGSLVEFHEFKENGLLKKIMTVTVASVQYHLVSYYSLDDAISGFWGPRITLGVDHFGCTPRLVVWTTPRGVRHFGCTPQLVVWTTPRGVDHFGCTPWLVVWTTPRGIDHFGCEPRLEVWTTLGVRWQLEYTTQGKQLLS